MSAATARNGDMRVGEPLTTTRSDVGCWLIGKTHMNAGEHGAVDWRRTALSARQAECGFDAWCR
jgi:hypothetical protein